MHNSGALRGLIKSEPLAEGLRQALSFVFLVNSLVFINLAAQANDVQSQFTAFRKILIFAPSTQDPRFIEQQKLLYRDIDGLIDRDISIIVISDRNSADVELGPKFALETAPLRERFDVPQHAFRTLLLTKTNKLLFEATLPVALTVIYGVIDRLPRRIKELQKRKKDA